MHIEYFISYWNEDYKFFHFFLHYGWFLQNLGKDFIRTNMHTTVNDTKYECIPKVNVPEQSSQRISIFPKELLNHTQIWWPFPSWLLARSQFFLFFFLLPTRRLMGSTNQDDPSCFYFRISWILMERRCFYFFHPLHFVQGLINQ